MTDFAQYVGVYM